MAINDKALKRQKFEKVWKIIRDELVEHAKSVGMPKDAVEWLSEVLSGCNLSFHGG
jgi:farnesyl diphosphate synthase